MLVGKPSLVQGLGPRALETLMDPMNPAAAKHAISILGGVQSIIPKLAQLLGVEDIWQKLSESLQQYPGSSQVDVIWPGWPGDPPLVAPTLLDDLEALLGLHRLDAANHETKERLTTCFLMVALNAAQGTTVAAEAHQQLRFCN
ncbi:hypothetical protein ABBQ38_014408 [Trebouxia sp. C0009 RCD-2024]